MSLVWIKYHATINKYILRSIYNILYVNTWTLSNVYLLISRYILLKFD